MSDESLISSLDAERTNGNEISKTYTISGHTLKVYTFAGEEYAYLDLTGCYYKVEPVRYVLAGEHSAGDATESGSVTAVSEKIVFASVFQTGWLTSDCFGKGYANAVISTNVSGFLSNSLANGEYLNTPTYSVTNFKTATGGKSSTNLSVQAIASNRSEIQSVFGDLSAEFSDLVADILGGYLFYWTRDVGSNLNNAQTISAGGITGTQMKMSELLGVRVTININTLACK